MQTDFVSVGTNWTVGQTIDYLRDEEDLPDEFFDLFVIDEDSKPLELFRFPGSYVLLVPPRCPRLPMRHK